MKRLALNREFAVRHFGVALLMLALCGWFGYDGFVRYPATPAAELYRAIEGRDAPEGCDLGRFKDQKTKTQYGFAALALLAALVVGGHAFAVSRFLFEYDDEGFAFRGRRTAYRDVKSVDRSRWEHKGIIRVDGVTLDAWHHVGVREVVANLDRARPPEAGR